MFKVGAFVGESVGITSGGQHGSTQRPGHVSIPTGQRSTQVIGRGPRCGHSSLQPLGFGPTDGQTKTQVLGFLGAGLPFGQRTGSTFSVGGLVGSAVGALVGALVGFRVGALLGDRVGALVGA
jgi:hypothetical protein